MYRYISPCLTRLGLVGNPLDLYEQIWPWNYLLPSGYDKKKLLRERKKRCWRAFCSTKLFIPKFWKEDSMLTKAVHEFSRLPQDDRNLNLSVETKQGNKWALVIDILAQFSKEINGCVIQDHWMVIKYIWMQEDTFPNHAVLRHSTNEILQASGAKLMTSDYRPNEIQSRREMNS